MPNKLNLNLQWALAAPMGITCYCSRESRYVAVAHEGLAIQASDPLRDCSEEKIAHMLRDVRIYVENAK